MDIKLPEILFNFIYATVYFTGRISYAREEKIGKRVWVLHRSFVHTDRTLTLSCFSWKLNLFYISMEKKKSSNIWSTGMKNYLHALFSDCNHYFEGTLEQSTLNVLKKNEVSLFTHFHDTGFLSLRFIALLTPCFLPSDHPESPQQGATDDSPRIRHPAVTHPAS